MFFNLQIFFFYLENNKEVVIYMLKKSNTRNKGIVGKRGYLLN